MMEIYIALLKQDVKLGEVKEKLAEEGMDFLKFYPMLNMVKIRAEKDPSKPCHEIFETVEKEKDDFSSHSH